jgi:hypothetical protein
MAGQALAALPFTRVDENEMESRRACNLDLPTRLG